MEQEPKENLDGCSSAPATGYATADDAIAWLRDERNIIPTRAESYMNIIIEELVRLRAERETLIESCALAVETQVPGTRYAWRVNSVFACIVGESAAQVRALKSHNAGAEGRRQ